MKSNLTAYLAGAIDSDGTIGIRRSTYGMRVRKDCSQPVYSERIALKQVTPQIPDLLASQFGGSKYLQDPSAKNGRPLYCWLVTDLRAYNCLVRLLPYLRVKKEQARNGIRLRNVKKRSMKAKVRRGRGHMGSAPRPRNLTQEMEAIFVRAKKLNRPGV